MGRSTQSNNWGAFSLAGLSAQLSIGARNTLYAVRNFDNNDTFLFLLADLGFGYSFGVRLDQRIRTLAKLILSDKYLMNSRSYTPIKANRQFSAGDLNLARGAEATIGVAAMLAGCSATSISAWPFFQGSPSAGEVDNDYFTGSIIYSTNDVGLSVTAAYQFLGTWFRVWSF